MKCPDVAALLFMLIASMLSVSFSLNLCTSASRRYEGARRMPFRHRDVQQQLQMSVSTTIALLISIALTAHVELRSSYHHRRQRSVDLRLTLTRS